MGTAEHSQVVETARTYYNSDDADAFYAHIWGGEDIHIGLYERPEDTISVASRRTVERMAAQLKLSKDSTVLDLGAGYGGSARFLVEQSGCRVDCLNLSEVQNNRNRKLNEAAGYAERIKVIDGDFEQLPFEGRTFDVVWSQDAFLHSGARRRVLEEAERVLREKGELIFTDIMQVDGADRAGLQPILDRIHLDSLGSPQFYRDNLAELGFKEVSFQPLTEQLCNHYSRVAEEIRSRRTELASVVSGDYLERMLVGLDHWVRGGREGSLVWGIFHFAR